MFRNFPVNASQWSTAGATDLSRAFSDSLPLPNTLEPTLEQALRHILRQPGRLVRPQLAVQVGACYGLAEARASDLAIALEYFHTASLLFDDLPCMDDAALRRGAPCVHRVYGEATAILSALAFINRAYALAWRAVATCPDRLQSDALAYLEQRLGVEGLLNGQSFDLHGTRTLADADAVEAIAVRKTVSLVQLTLVLPALLGGAPEQELQWLGGLARCWGLSYQILDDIKDVLQNEDEAGKSTGRDESLARPNLALSVGVGGAVQRLFERIEEGDELLLQLIAYRPEASFLEKTGNDLKEDAALVSRRAWQIVEQDRT
jgi:geranylgeranyl diphosphate synthase type II